MSPSELGKVHVITGPGKGKTTAAFGLAMRAAGHGFKVCVIQFMKTGDVTGEALSAKHLEGFELVQFGAGRFIDPKRPSAADKAAADEAVDYLRKRVAKGGCQLLVLDEVNVAASFGLVQPKEIVEIIGSRREGVEVVLTGRDAPQEFIDLADYVSYVDNRKHPHSKGLRSRKGVEW